MYSPTPRTPRQLLYAVLFVTLGFTLRLDAQLDTAIVPNHYIVLYRNGVIPGDAEVRAHSVGTQLQRRYDRFGIVTIAYPGSISPADDAATLQHLAALPNVQYAMHDRTVTTSALTIKPAIYPSFSISTIPIHLNPIPPASSSQPVLPTLPPKDTYYNSPQGWAVRQVGGYGHNVPGGPAHGPWDTTMGAGARIAILDSGVDAYHPDIAPNLGLNLSEVNQNASTGLPSACDDGSPQDQAGHGTWTASLAVGALGPGTGETVGVAPQATLLNIKVLERMPANGAGVGASNASLQCTNGQASGLLSWVIQGIQDAMANHADVISMSLGTTVDLSTGEGAGIKAMFDSVTYAASQAGIVIVAAAGNDGYDLSNTRYLEIPAQSRGVLAIVASTNPACAENNAAGATCVPGPITLPYYSNFGAPLQALAAPGGSYPEGADTAVSGWIRGACSAGKPSTTDGLPNDPSQSFGCFNLGHTQYVQAMGTSASTPLAAGVAALLRSAHLTWSATDIIAAMRSNAVSTAGLSVGQIDASQILGK